MSSTPFSPRRRYILTASAAVAAAGLIPGSLFAATGDNKIRPFKANVPEASLVDLRRRLAATRWPGNETVNNQSQGVQLARMQALVQYWGADYDWRKGEAKLNALSMFMTEIDSLDIQFIHVRSRHKNAMPFTKWTREGTSLRGNNRRSLRRRSALHSERCVRPPASLYESRTSHYIWGAAVEVSLGRRVKVGR
jgi:hypothetical protein